LKGEFDVVLCYRSSNTDHIQGEGAPDKAEELTTEGSAVNGLQRGSAPSPPNPQLSQNPLRSLGDALSEIRQRFDEILAGQDLPSSPREHRGDPTEASQVEYIRPDDVDHDMQTLGPAGEEQVAKLNDLKLVDDDGRLLDSNLPMDIDPPVKAPPLNGPLQSPSQDADPISQPLMDNVDGALTQSDVRNTVVPDVSGSPFKSSIMKDDVEMEDTIDDSVKDVEAELRQWQVDGQPGAGAEHIWRLYESLTHDLAYALCEQLRLILEPTLATRLKGDYRMGKRLNMKKIIPYIASDYTKDKIWLRRTRASQREYQVLIALDDSRSMAESHSVHLAYETMALVSKALGRLEVGDIAIAKFGESVEILHGFEEGPFTDQAGSRVMNAFQFNQKATNVLSLVETSLRVLEVARERRSMNSTSAADLWQLEIIISDGICQDHDRLRTVLRKAEEQRVMIVFIVIDSLHSAAATGSRTDSTAESGSIQSSILAMNQVAYQNVDGRMELKMERYLDSFPFEYYVVLRNVEALPEVLTGTLKQFFERISEE
jgi:midasin